MLHDYVDMSNAITLLKTMFMEKKYLVTFSSLSSPLLFVGVCVW